MSTENRPTRTRTNSMGIVAGVVAMVLSLLNVLNRVLTGRASEALPQLGLFVAMSAVLAYLIHRRRVPRQIDVDHLNRLKVGGVMIMVFAMLLWAGVIAFALGEAGRNHQYGWLLLIPAALWGLRVQILGIGKIMRASPDDPRWPRSGGDID